MAVPSLIYRNIHLYRLAMRLLYRREYRRRMVRVTDLLGENDTRVLELCFGDVQIARYCRRSNRQWVGFDINASFARRAVQERFDARCADLFEIKSLPEADVVVMVGSLYHFHDDLERILKLMLASAPRIIIWEPTKTLSERHDLVGILARHSANAGNGQETFRYSETRLVSKLNAFSERLGFQYMIVSRNRDMLLEIRHTCD